MRCPAGWRLRSTARERFSQRYERGNVIYKLKVIGECEPEKTGTMVSFLPDDEIFDDTIFDYDTLKRRFREMAFLTKGLHIVLTDEEEGRRRRRTLSAMRAELRSFVTYLNRSNTELYPDIIYCEGEKDGVMVEVAMQHNDAYTENSYSFVNNITTRRRNPCGGVPECTDEDF